jgi:hypothetical protein
MKHITIVILAFFCSFTYLPGQKIIDSLIIEKPRGTAYPQFTFHLNGVIFQPYEDDLFLVNFQSGQLDTSRMKHGFSMETGFNTSKIKGISTTFCHDLNLQSIGHNLLFSFSNFILPNNGYRMNLITVEKEQSAAYTFFERQYAFSSPAYYWQDKLVYFDGGSRNQISMLDPKTDRIVYQTPLNRYITNPSTNSQFDLCDDLAGLIVKESDSNIVLFGLLDLKTRRPTFKKITLPAFTTGGSFNKLFLQDDLFYLIYTGSEIPYYKDEAKFKNKKYLVEVNFKTEQTRYFRLSDLLEEDENFGVEQSRISMESDKIYIFQSRQDIKNPRSPTPFLQELISVDKKSMNGKNELTEHSNVRKTILPFENYYLSYHLQLNQNQANQEVFYLFEKE